ncbi:MAG TPA: hypothetical protein VJZ00_23320 [Thermoanaerobaculia bacterium]|nr:hypothetical protein [Thermoanaerobaculia bacterium]
MYRYVETSTNPVLPRQSGRVWIDGPRQRLDLDREPVNPAPFDVTITVGQKRTFIDLREKTYFEAKLAPVAAISSSASAAPFLLPRGLSEVKEQPVVNYQNAGSGAPIGKFATTKHIIRVRYAIEANSQHADVSAVITMLTADALPRIESSDRFVRAGLPEVDEPLSKALSSTKGMIVGYDVSVTRSGSSPASERKTMTITELQTREIDPRLFVRPTGLTRR